MTTDNTQELDEILDSVLIGMYCTNPDGDFVPLDDSKNVLRAEAKQSLLDWHNKQIEALLNEMLVDVSSPNASIDQAEMIELINLYINKLKESKDEQHNRRATNTSK